MTGTIRTIFSIFTFITLLLTGCSPVKTQTAAVSAGPSVAAVVSSTPLLPTNAATATLHPTITKFLTSARANTSTPLPTFPPSTPEYLGTAIPSGAEVISSKNIHRLKHVAQWGKGMILGTAFTPDGSRFVAGSAFGLGVNCLADIQITGKSIETVRFPFRLVGEV